jgi:hypothetical protein
MIDPEQSRHSAGFGSDTLMLTLSPPRRPDHAIKTRFRNLVKQLHCGPAILASP